MPTQAKKDGNARHIAKLDMIKIQPYKEEGAAIRAAAAAAGMSVQAYVLQAVRTWMERERDGSARGGLPEKAPQGAMEEAGGVDKGSGDISIFSDGAPTPHAIAAVSSTQDEKLSPSELSPDDWAEWARRRDDESLEDWKTRLKKSNIGTSPIDIMKRIGKLPKYDRNLILETDPA